MNNNDRILKRAFTDAFCEKDNGQYYEFSKVFEEKMQLLIRNQRGIFRLINTASKRAAIIFLIVVIALSTVACSVKEIREPILEEIEKFFFNANEFLKGTTADEVSHLFPSDVTQIVATDYISQTNKKYIIDDEKKIKEFISLISNIYFNVPKSYQKYNKSYVYWSFDFYDREARAEIRIDMCADENFDPSLVKILKDGQEYNYYINDFMYRKLLSFTNRELYLHDSVYPYPDKEFLNRVRGEVTANLTENELKEIKNTVRHAHYSIEVFLLENVSLLKNGDSVYWEYFLSGEFYTDPITGAESIFSVYDNYESSVYKGIIADLDAIAEKSENKVISEEFKNISKLFKKASKEHNLEGLFLAHEYIHDYDYFLYNYPTHYVYDGRADFQGTDDYFGHLQNY